MKKLIVVIMALITIFSASVTAYAEVFVDWAVVDYITNLQMSSQNCVIVKYNTSAPTPSLCDSTGAIKTQQTTYSVLLSMYETVTVEGASWKDNVLTYGRFVWYEYGGYCWIKYIPDSNGATCWVANYQGKILYCEAPEEESQYTFSAIAGATGYCITNRPAGTTDSGYLGDLLVTQDNLTTIHGIVANLGGDADYYIVLRIINGEYRYYIMCTYPNRSQYFVCNTSGQLFYALKDEPEDVSGTTGGTFDATEVITAINSVYNKLDSGFEVVTKGINETNNRITSLNDDFILHMNNTVSGLSAANGTLTTIADYLSGLMNKQIIERSITYSGTDVFIDWDTSRTVVDVATADIEDDIYVKSAYGERQEGVEGTVSVSNGFELVTDENGYYRVVVTKDYPEHNPNPPVGTVLYYDFEDSSTDDMMLSPVIGDAPLTFSYTASVSGESVSGEQCVHFWDTDYDYPITGSYSAGLCNAENKAFSVSLWYNPNMFPSTGYYQFRFGTSKYFSLQVTSAGILRATYYATSSATATTTVTTEATLSTSEWNHIAACYDGATLYLFLNGELCYEKTTAVYPPKGGDFRFFTTSSTAENMGCYMDDFLWVDGSAIWTSAFDPYESAVFSRITDDYYLSVGWPSYYRTYTDDEGNVWGEQNQPLYSFSSSTTTDDDYVPTSMGRLCDDVSYIYFDIYNGKWKLYDCLSKREFDYVGSNFNENFMFPVDNYTTHSPDIFTVATFNDYVVGSPVWLDIPDGGTITVTYLEYVNWFESVYSLMDTQSEQLSIIAQKLDNTVGDTIINIENTVVDITQDSDAYNIFYVEKTDGTTESVGDAAKDAAVFVGDVLSMFYRLVFDDALDNAGVIQDFEDVLTTTNTGVNVW